MVIVTPYGVSSVLMSGILTDKSIQEAVTAGTIVIDPFDPARMNAASYDLTLGDGVAVYKNWVSTESTQPVQDGKLFQPRGREVNVQEEPEVVRFKINPTLGWVLNPGIGYLMHTTERVWTDAFVPILDGKSSIGRLFIQVHATAGYGDPGFDGQYTLEVIAQHPIRIYPGMRICQIRFQTMEGTLSKTYDQRPSNYKGLAARGAVPSRAFKMFGA